MFNYEPLYVSETNEGLQRIFRFDNHYGASVIDGIDSIVPYELAVLWFYEYDDCSWGICYDTPITDDVLNIQTIDELNIILDEINNIKG